VTGKTELVLSVATTKRLSVGDMSSRPDLEFLLLKNEVMQPGATAAPPLLLLLLPPLPPPPLLLSRLRFLTDMMMSTMDDEMM